MEDGMLRVIACVTQNHNLALLVFAACLCLLTSAAAFAMLSRSKQRENRLREIWGIAAGATAGLGVWATHFVAMTAYDPGVPLGFEGSWLLISLFISISAQCGSFWALTKFSGAPLKILLGLASGLGIALMHFSGMNGLIAPAIIMIDLWLAIAAIASACGFAIAAVWVFHHPRSLRHKNLKSGLLFVAAICGLHFIGMGALSFTPIPGASQELHGLSRTLLGVIVGFGTLMVIVTSLAAALADAYLHDRNREENIRLHQTVKEHTSRLIMLAQEQEALREQAEAANRAKSQFLATMTHELRTPLNAIIGYSEIIQEDAISDELKSIQMDAERISRAGKHLLRIINDVLDLSKIEAGRIQLDLREFDVTTIALEALEAVTLAAKGNDNRLTISTDRDLPIARNDSLKLKQCLINLLSNAVKFTKSGQIALRIGHEKTPQGGFFRFDVSDTGIGLSAEQVSKLFQAFVQADSSVTRTHGGTGLGLTITQRLAQIMGGDATVASTLGVGSTFSIRIAENISDAQVALLEQMQNAQMNMARLQDIDEKSGSLELFREKSKAA